MTARTKVLAKTARVIVGATIGAVGAAVCADGSEGFGVPLLLLGLAIGISGALTVMIKVGFVALYTGAMIVLFYLEPIEQLFESHGPDWWSFFWWVPVTVIIVVVLFAATIYVSMEDE